MNGQKDMVYCPQGSHIVPREAMTKMLTAKGVRRLCTDCKDKTMDRRAEIAKLRVQDLRAEK